MHINDIENKFNTSLISGSLKLSDALNMLNDIEVIKTCIVIRKLILAIRAPTYPVFLRHSNEYVFTLSKNFCCVPESSVDPNSTTNCHALTSVININAVPNITRDDLTV